MSHRSDAGNFSASKSFDVSESGPNFLNSFTLVYLTSVFHISVPTQEIFLDVLAAYLIYAVLNRSC